MNSSENSAALPQTQIQNAASSPVISPLFITEVSAGNLVDSNNLNFLTRLLEEELSSEKGGNLRVVKTESSRHNVFHERRWIDLAGGVRFLRALIYAIPRCSSVHLFHTTSVRFLTFTLPAIMLGRFFGKKIILHYLSQRVELDFEKISEAYTAALKLCDQIVVSTRYAQAQLSGYDIKADVVRLPVAPLAEAKVAEHNLQPKIIMVCAYEKYANLTCALKAFKLVKMKYPRAEITIAGSGSQHFYLERFIANNKILGVELLNLPAGEMISNLMLEADLYLNSSAVGTLPGSLLEAMSLGLPVISTDVGGINEVITDRQSGLLVRSNDHVAITDRIIELIEHPSLVEQLSKSAIEAAAKYSWDNLRASWLSLVK